MHQLYTCIRSEKKISLNVFRVLKFNVNKSIMTDFKNIKSILNINYHIKYFLISIFEHWLIKLNI